MQIIWLVLATFVLSTTAQSQSVSDNEYLWSRFVPEIALPEAAPGYRQTNMADIEALLEHYGLSEHNDDDNSMDVSYFQPMFDMLESFGFLEGERENIASGSIGAAGLSYLFLLENDDPTSGLDYFRFDFHYRYENQTITSSRSFIQLVENSPSVIDVGFGPWDI